MELILLDPIKDPRWISFISNQCEANIFHHPSWLLVLKAQYKFNVFAVCTMNDSNEICAGIPVCEIISISKKKRWISLPFSDHSSILFNSFEARDLINLYMIKMFEKYNLDLISIHSTIEAVDGFLKESRFVLHQISILGNENEMKKSFHRTKIQGISKAERDGLTAKIGTDYDSIQRFYKLHLLTRRKIGVPTQPMKFLIRIQEYLIQKGLGFIILILKDDIDIAAGLFLEYNGVLTYKYNASNPKFLHLRPNNLLVWSAVKECIKNSYRLLDFGKTVIENKGLREFKMGWGANESTLNDHYYPYVPSISVRNFIMKGMLKSFIKNSPPVISKIIGELAYKYFPS